MYTLLVFIHVLALVYWLGGDLGTYISSQYVLREDLSVESRQTAFNILLACDMGPKLAMPIIVGAGLHLSTMLWGTFVPQPLAIAGWTVVVVWLVLILAQHSSKTASWPMLSDIDLFVRFAVIGALIFFAIWVSQQGAPIWLSIKVAVFTALVACGIAVRFALRPFVMDWTKLLKEGATAEVNARLRKHMAVCRRYVWVIWFGLFLNTALGVKLIPI
jgi:hypothetical protein